jgi:hypothetical protein
MRFWYMCSIHVGCVCGACVVHACNVWITYLVHEQCGGGMVNVQCGKGKYAGKYV